MQKTASTPHISQPATVTACRGLMVPGARSMCFPQPDGCGQPHPAAPEAETAPMHRVPPRPCSFHRAHLPKALHSHTQQDGRHRAWSTARLWPLHKTKETNTGTSDHKLTRGTRHDAIKNGRREGITVASAPSFQAWQAMRYTAQLFKRSWPRV